MSFTLANEIAHAEGVLRLALMELAARIATERHDDDTAQLVEHCREMTEILAELVDRLSGGAEQTTAHARAALLGARFAELRHRYGLTRLH